jgi:uncharacterized protein YdaU (DUF1376 family)
MTDIIDVSTFVSLHAGDTLKEISGRPLPEIGAQFLLLLRFWINGGSLPSDSERLRRLAGADRDEWPAIWAQLSPLWATSEDGQSVVHAGLAVQVGRARAAKLKAIERGRAGGSAPHPSQRGTPRTSRDRVENKSRQSRDGAEPEIEHRVEMEPSLLTPNSEPPDLLKRDQPNIVDPLTEGALSRGEPAGPGGAGAGEVLPLVLVSPEPEATRPSKPDSWKNVLAVFRHYHHAHHHPMRRRLKPTSKTARAIATRLRDGWTVEELCKAVDGFHLSPHHQGQNDRGTVYLDLYLFVRDEEQVEKGIGYAENPPKPGKPARGGRIGAEECNPAIFAKTGDMKI